MATSSNSDNLKTRQSHYLLSAVLAVAAAEAVAWLTVAALELCGYEIRPQRLVQAIISPYDPWQVKVRIFLAVAVVAPAIEELVFRAGLFKWLLRDSLKLSFGVASALSATLFAAVHFYLPGVPALVFLGCAFAWQYEKTGRLAAPVFTHSLFNATNFFVAIAASTRP